MIIRVISLLSRTDRRKKFEEVNGAFLEGHDWSFFDAIDGKKLTHNLLKQTGFDTDKYWRDPLLKRTLTKGEVGCFMSHWKLWEDIADSGQTTLILEDDIILKQQVSESLLDGDLTYLCYKEMLPEGVNGNRVCYPYWAAAYILTPQGAEKLLETDVDENIIPVDEFLPRMTDRLKMTFVDVASQTPRKEGGTDIEPRSHHDYFLDFTVHNLTCHDNDEKAFRLLETNPSVKNICWDVWKGGNMQSMGGGQKIVCLQEYLDELPDHDVVLFSDGFDVFFSRDVDEIVGRFLDMKTEAVFAAERYIWPDKSLRFPPTTTPYRYLNSGCFIGRVGELKKIVYDVLNPEDDDQLYLQHRYLSGRYDMKLDVEQYIFVTHEPEATVKNGMLYNPITRCFGCVYHGNGGAEAKEKLNQLYHAHFPEKKYANLEVSSFRRLGHEMLLVDFLTPSQCEEWIRIGEEHGGWNPHPADKFPSHDIHLKQLGLWEEVDSWWNKIAARVFEDYWRPTKNYHLRKAFLMKYSEDTQKTLGLHNDASMVTGSVKLNDDYEGATLYFPRQGISNKDVPIGKMILFPGQVTHGHYVDELKSGTKYSATFWSARYKGDLLED